MEMPITMSHVDISGATFPDDDDDDDNNASTTVQRDTTSASVTEIGSLFASAAGPTTGNAINLQLRSDAQKLALSSSSNADMATLDALCYRRLTLTICRLRNPPI